MAKHKVVLYNTEGVGTTIEEQVLTNGKYDNFNLIRIDGDNDERFFAEAQNADGVIIVYLKTDREALSKLKSCKVLTIHAIGVNNIDLKAATEFGICIGNVPDYCIEEVATHTVGMALDCARKITQLDRSVREGKWDVYAAGKMYRTKGRTYGLVAFGNIPRRIAELLKPFGMKLVTYDPFVSDEILKQYGVERAESLESLFAQSDYISVHTPLLPTTRHLIGKELFDVIKPGAVVIATGRGGVIDEDALKAAIESGRVTAAAIDVIENEGAVTSPLMGMDQVIMTPHAAYYSEDSCDECRVKAMEQVVEVLEHKKLPRYLVNKDVDGVARFQK